MKESVAKSDITHGRAAVPCGLRFWRYRERTPDSNASDGQCFDAVYFYKGQDRFSMQMPPQPLYRYGRENGEILDGGLFAFVDGTNAMLLFHFELRRTDAGDRWHYGIAPITVHEARVTHRGKTVFSIPFRESPFDPHETQFNREWRMKESDSTDEPSE